MIYLNFFKKLNLGNLFKALICSFLNLLILLIIYIFITKFSQGFVIPLDLYMKTDAASFVVNILIFHFLLSFLALIMTLYPTYIFAFLFERGKKKYYSSDKKGLIFYKYTEENVRLHFSLAGKYSFHYNQLQQTFSNISGTHNLMYSNGFDIQVNSESLDLETFGVRYPKELFIKYTNSSNDALKKFAKKIAEGKSTLISNQWKNIDYPTYQIIQQIIHCQYKGDLKDLFLLSKSIELLVRTCEAHNTITSNKSRFIHSKLDKEKVMDVKELINTNLESPPSISEIAKIVGLNEYKLKGGFKEIFGMTIFGYVREERLSLAYRYLVDTEKSIAIIADQLGYSSPQHFSNAFKKKFKKTPLSVRKNSGDVNVYAHNQ